WATNNTGGASTRHRARPARHLGASRTRAGPTTAATTGRRSRRGPSRTPRTTRPARPNQARGRDR
ncbi:MAG: hypothetical protein AVDCRST_MAG88-2435, partial [uncultured Thermomicrobiales bacterium]